MITSQQAAPKPRWGQRLLSLTVLLNLAAIAPAATVVWEGTTDDTWTGANWNVDGAGGGNLPPVADGGDGVASFLYSGHDWTIDDSVDATPVISEGIQVQLNGGSLNITNADVTLGRSGGGFSALNLGQQGASTTANFTNSTLTLRRGNTSQGPVLIPLNGSNLIIEDCAISLQDINGVVNCDLSPQSGSVVTLQGTTTVEGRQFGLFSGGDIVITGSSVVTLSGELNARDGGSIFTISGNASVTAPALRTNFGTGVIEGGLTTLTNANPLRSSNAFDGDVSITSTTLNTDLIVHTDLSNNNANLAAKVAQGYFAVDGARLNPTIDPTSDWSQAANIAALNSELDTIARDLGLTRTIVVTSDGSQQTLQLAFVFPDGPRFTWTGLGSDDELGTAANWLDINDQPNAPTFAGGELLIFAGNTRLTPVNNITGRTVASIWFDPTAQGFNIGGTQSLDIAGQINVLSSTAQEISAPLQFDTDVQLAVTSGELTLSGVISGLGGFTKSGGNLVLSNGANSFDGEANLNDGLVSLGAAGALGSANGGTTISGNATLQLLNAITETTEPFAIVGRGSTLTPHIIALAGAAEVTSDITSRGINPNHNFQAASGATLTFSGNFITDSLSPDQIIRMQFGGEGDTVFSGNVVENDGRTVLVRKDNGLGSLTLTGTPKLHTNGTVNASGTMVFNTIGTNPAPNSQEFSFRTDTTSDFTPMGGVLALSEGQLLALQTDTLIVGEVQTAAYSRLAPGSFAGTGPAGENMVLPDGLLLVPGAELSLDIDQSEGGPVSDIVVSGGDFEVTATALEPVIVNINGITMAGGPYTVLDWTGATVVGSAPTSAQFVVAGASSDATAEVVGTTLQVTINSIPTITTLLVTADGTDSVESVVVNEFGEASDGGNFIPTAPDGEVGYVDSFGDQFPLNDLRGIARDAAGNVYIAENTEFGRVLKFDDTGTFVSLVAEESSAGETPSLPGRPNFMALAPDGMLYVTLFEVTPIDFGPPEPYAGVAAIDTTNGTVNGSFIVNADPNNAPTGIAIVPIGGGDYEIVVADSALGQFVRYSSAGAVVTPLTSTAGNDPNDLNVGFSLAAGLTYEPFNGFLIASAQSETDIFLLNDPLAENLLYDDPSIETLLMGGANNQATGLAYVAGQVLFGHKGLNRIRIAPGAADLLSTPYEAPADLLVYQDSTFDINQDGNVNFLDADILFEALAGPDNRRPLDVLPADFSRADLDSDGDVDLADLQLLMRAVSL